ncbi:MAG TPA: twin-arginine translocation signal domain-containing protein, partial [Anaeromyxobacteraceae bacterium]|nr:twin-arginine translocation signal domain-containing protein [Anaeromyxobacteraceae bacterium]
MTIGRRDLLKGLATGGAAAALGELLVVKPSRAEELKRAGASEFTTVCNFCSCGCGMVGHVVEGKLVNLEGDPDHVVNEGSLCVKGSAAFATHQSMQRLTTPRYRAPGSDRWVDISWDDALDRLARKRHPARPREGLVRRREAQVRDGLVGLSARRRPDPAAGEGPRRSALRLAEAPAALRSLHA